jgi:hypothetical protein
MLSKLGRRLASGVRVPKTSLLAPVLGAKFSTKKLGIGDALTVLEEKISKVSQIVDYS